MQKALNFQEIDPELLDSYLSKCPPNPQDLFLLPKDTSLIDFSIINPSDPDHLHIESLLSSQSFASLKESKALALFIGHSIGDSLGAHLECLDYNPSGYSIKGFEEIESRSSLQKGQWTDDTSEALCLADSLLTNDLSFDPIDIRTRFFLWWFSGYNNGKKNQKGEKNDQVSYGIGGYTLKGLTQFLYDRQPFVDKKELSAQTNSNGSIMRIAPIPIAFHSDIKAGLEYAAKQSYCTHDGLEASECCRLLTWLGIKGLNHSDKGFKAAREILDLLGKEFQTDVISIKCLANSEKEKDFSFYEKSELNKGLEDRDWNWKDPKWKYSEFRVQMKRKLVGIYCMDCVCMALHIVYHNEGFRNCVLKAINLGGDADSLGGVVGMLIGTFYGFTEEIREFYKYIQKWDQNGIALKAYKLLNLRK